MRKIAKQAAMEYISGTYPDFEVCYLEVTYHGMPNTLHFMSQNSPESRYDLKWEDTMSAMSPEQLEPLVE